MVSDFVLMPLVIYIVQSIGIPTKCKFILPKIPLLITSHVCYLKKIQCYLKYSGMLSTHQINLLETGTKCAPQQQRL